jgi:signal-transduction protein with cAMP-binding, CBS, and nucleotidyltransferase domain
MKVEDIMRKKLETIEDLSSIQKAAQKMKDKNVSSLVVVDGTGQPQGLVTERDLVWKVCIKDIRTSTVTNKEIMSSPMITIKSNSSPSEAADMMLQHNIRHLLVVHSTDSNPSNNPIGILTPLDFTRYQEYAKDNEKDSIEKILEYYI